VERPEDVRKGDLVELGGVAARPAQHRVELVDHVHETDPCSLGCLVDHLVHLKGVVSDEPDLVIVHSRQAPRPAVRGRGHDLRVPQHLNRRVRRTGLDRRIQRNQVRVGVGDLHAEQVAATGPGRGHPGVAAGLHQTQQQDVGEPDVVPARGHRDQVDRRVQQRHLLLSDLVSGLARARQEPELRLPERTAELRSARPHLSGIRPRCHPAWWPQTLRGRRRETHTRRVGIPQRRVPERQRRRRHRRRTREEHVVTGISPTTHRDRDHVRGTRVHPHPTSIPRHRTADIMVRLSTVVGHADPLGRPSDPMPHEHIAPAVGVPRNELRRH